MQKNNNLNQQDSISIWITASKDKSLKFQRRKFFLDKAYSFSLNEENDSIQNAHLLRIALEYFKLRDSLLFREVNKKSTSLSKKLNDSISLAANYWDLGNFYSNNVIKDSAFYSFSKAQRIYEALRNDYFSGRMFLNMAIVQSDVKDYIGSEITTIKAISYLKPLKKYKQLYQCYNNLGISFNNLEEYGNALIYHNIALEYQEKINSDNTFKENTLNNIGYSYELQKKYNQSILYYQDALNNKNLKKDNSKLYAKLLDNLAYSKFKLNDTSNTKKLFYQSLKIRDSLNDYLGIAMNKLHLSEYYAFKKDTIKAIQYAKETRQLASSTKNFRELLPSLLLLSKLDKESNSKYTTRYIQLNDSLQKEERAIRNKFARIQFETDEVITKNERLSLERNLILLALSSIVLLAALTYVSIRKRIREKELLFVQEQQKANEEIYNLMISQQNKLDEGSRKEKKRISEELHDGVLGKLFGARLILGNLNDSSDKESILKRKKYINDLQDIEEEVRNVSHELSNQSLISNISYTNMIDNLLESQSGIINFEYKTKYDKHIIWKEINGGLKMNLYRIIQEAIQNINKYSKAKYVNVEFKIDKSNLSLSIKDDGIGFKTEVKTKGIGIKNMKSRVDKLNGKLSINSRNGNGTLIIIIVPLNG